MLFTSLAFFIFLAVTLIFFYALPKKCQWIVLLVASFIFYLSFSWKFLFFIISTIVTIYGATYGIDKVNKTQEKYLAETISRMMTFSKEKNSSNIRYPLAKTNNVLYNISVYLY